MNSDQLRAHGLKKTPLRQEILNIFDGVDYALSASDVIARLKTRNDRVSVYRALSCFEQNGILHKASEDGNGVKYALCGQNCPPNLHSHEHAHFICTECQKTYCMNEVTVPNVEINSDFSITGVDFVIRGICRQCKSKKD